MSSQGASADPFEYTFQNKDFQKNYQTDVRTSLRFDGDFFNINHIVIAVIL